MLPAAPMGRTRNVCRPPLTASRMVAAQGVLEERRLLTRILAPLRQAHPRRALIQK